MTFYLLLLLQWLGVPADRWIVQPQREQAAHAGDHSAERSRRVRRPGDDRLNASEQPVDDISNGF